ncbi:hypothetical protein [Streptomyces sp. NPDC047829]|uniref:hypothetical protein n=1 Tax=Streptomyces sp. NPDC047829 TaxID=3154609 RepID=UPI0033FB974F
MTDDDTEDQRDQPHLSRHPGPAAQRDPGHDDQVAGEPGDRPGIRAVEADQVDDHGARADRHGRSERRDGPGECQQDGAGGQDDHTVRQPCAVRPQPLRYQADHPVVADRFEGAFAFRPLSALSALSPVSPLPAARPG